MNRATSRTFRLGEAGSPEITVTPDLLRGPRVSVAGRPVAPEREGIALYWPIRMADGSERRLRLTGQLVGLRAIVDGTEYPIERRLAPWELVLAVLPIGLVPAAVGGAGLLTGGIATGVSLALFRLPWPTAARVVGWAILAVVAAIVGGLAAPLLA
ncbi:MAG TPA: hypothetical protein VFS32_04610 [Candidatus Limnocylindrales bacterium]|nr:hypothetical protein [Candidatus Limnocylindrales bacterium]